MHRTRTLRQALWASGVSAMSLLCAWGPELLAQPVTGSVSGIVLDPAGRGVAARVEAVAVETGRSLGSAATAEGAFAFPALPPGPYELRPSADGLAAPASRVVVRVGTSAVVELRMDLETVRFAVDVVDATPLLEQRTGAVGSVIERAEMRNLPLNQRVFLPLVLLGGGAHKSAPGSELSTQNDSGFHVAGAREASNNFLLDGIDNNDLYINRIVISPPLDSVREFRLHASGYEAEFGRNSGGQVNVVTRSGTLQFRGSAYHYMRNDALDARNHFDPDPRPPTYRRGQFGGALGGPINRRHTYFFSGFEGTRIRDAATRTAAVPSAAERQGDFSGSPGAVIDPFAGAPFPSNIVPAARQDPPGRMAARYWPDPNRPDSVQNFVSTPLGDALVNQLTGRIDHHRGPGSRLFARYSHSHARSFSPFADSDVPGFGSFTLDRGRQMAASFTQTLSPRTQLEVRAGFNHLRREVAHQNAGNDISASLGIRGLSKDPRFVGFPGINVGGYASLADDSALPILRSSRTAHVTANLLRDGGGHRFKAGGEARVVRIDGTQGLFGRGQFNFLGAIAQNAVADLLLGFPTYSIQTVIDNDFRQRASSWGAYAQDEWQAGRRVTLSIGVRYEYNRPARDAHDRFTHFDHPSLSLVRAGTSPLGRAGYAADRNNIAPRLGLAWNTGGGTVLRAAYGIFHDLNVLEANSGLYFNPPYFELKLFFPSQFSLPRLSDPFAGSGYTPPASVNSVQPDFRTAYGQHWSMGVERSLPGGLVGRASYIGSKSSKLLRRRNLNQPSPGPGEVDARRPTAGFSNIVLFESAASSTYHSGVFSIERRFRGNVGLRAAHTWSKSIDDVSAFLGSAGDQAFPQDSNNFRAERGLSNFDQRGRFTLSLQLASPSRHPLLENWRAFAIATAGSGRPLTPQLAVDNSNTGNTGGIFGADRPHLVGDPRARGTGLWFRPDAFAMPAALTFGNAGRNILTGPGFASFDVALVRAFPVSEAATAELRVEVFNLANRTNFDLPERTFGQATFGRSLSAGQARQLQAGFRFSF